MAWVRIHDGAMTNPKIEALSDSAFRLWVKGLCYCQIELTDGLIPRAALRKMKPRRHDVEALTTPIDDCYGPLWETHDIGFKVHDYLFWNDSRDKVRDRQQRARDRLEKWKREHETKRVSERVHSSARNGEDNGTQTEPNQTMKDKTSPSDSLRERFDRFWAIYPKKVGKDAALRAWRRRQPSQELTNTVLAALAWQVKQPQWTKDRGQYVPNPATWINRGQWQDEPPTEQRSAEWLCPHEPPCSGGRNDCFVKQQIEAGKVLA